ncbi:hypothetical protein Pgy4_26445, partial [Pseudomonas savastanoi pv. glycinea str. race 4]
GAGHVSLHWLNSEPDSQKADQHSRAICLTNGALQQEDMAAFRGKW